MSLAKKSWNALPPMWIFEIVYSLSIFWIQDKYLELTKNFYYAFFLSAFALEQKVGRLDQLTFWGPFQSGLFCDFMKWSFNWFLLLNGYWFGNCCHLQVFFQVKMKIWCPFGPRWSSNCIPLPTHSLSVKGQCSIQVYSSDYAIS